MICCTLARFFIRQLLFGRCARQISQSQNHQLARIHPDIHLSTDRILLLLKLTSFAPGYFQQKSPSKEDES
jgi:hypothetical protein